MGSNALEQQLGELSGQLKSLVPALERLEERVREAERYVAASEARHEALRIDYSDLKQKVSTRQGDLYGKINSFNLDIHNLGNEIESIKKDLEENRKNSEGMSNKLWEIAKLFLAGGAGALASFLSK